MQPSLHLRSENPYHLIWDKYESIRQLLNRANKLFGIFIVTNQLCYICIGCLCLYWILGPERPDSVFRLCGVYVLISTAARTIGGNWLLSHLYLSCCELKNSIVGILNKKWQLLSHEHRDVLSFFFICLDRRNLVVCPLNLYNVDPTNLPSLLTLLISYVIVLQQTS